MKPLPIHRLPRILSGAIAILLFGSQTDSVHAATFVWGNITGSFTVPANWGGTAPSGTDATDVLVFGGDVGIVGGATNYTASSDSPTNPFLINQLMFQATSMNQGVPNEPAQTIGGTTPLLFGGASPAIMQDGTAPVVITAPIKLGANLSFAGNPPVGADILHDKANVTLNGTLSGNFDIAKSGSGTFRFGSATGTSVSENNWFGALSITDGTIRFNNNAYTAPTALRSNPVFMGSGGALLTTLFKAADPASSLRFGTLSGTAGTVEGKRETATAGVFSSIDIGITALSSGSFDGTLQNTAIGVGGNTSGKFVLRGVGTQTFTGALNLSKDVEIGDIATLVLANNATLGNQTTGTVILTGGTMKLDNTSLNSNNRLRNGNSGSTGLETIGGGTLSLIGNATLGTEESASRIQLGSAANSRSGGLTINITHNAGSTAITSLNFESYARDSAGNPYDTVNFTANDGSGSLPLGEPGNGPRITFISGTVFNIPIVNGLLANTTASGAPDPSSVGWATVNGTAFASYGVQGVVAATTSAAPTGGGIGDATLNAEITGNLPLTNAGYALNSLKIAPAAAGQSLSIAAGAQLKTNGILLAGSTDFTISGTGLIGNAGLTPTGGQSPRYFHVTTAGTTLTVTAAVNGAIAPIVKVGDGTLVLTNSSNIAVTQPVVINGGTLRATPGTSLPDGEIRFRGGVLEITGGGTFNRQIGPGTNQLTWSGLDGLGAAIGQEQGSGGFSAFGANATVDLSPVTGNTDFAWEDNGFVNSGHALLFGSVRANATLTWVDNINLTSFNQVVNYNARQFRAIDNPASANDVAVLSGTISGTVRNDFLKTGNGELILTGNNTYFGATLITNGTLRVNGSATNSFLTDVRDGGTLGGAGTVAGVQVEGNGTVAPGDLTGHSSILNTGDFKFAATGAKLTIELGGTTAGGNGVTGYDRVNVTGGVTLAGGQLTGSLINNFTVSSPNDLFFIIINDGTDAVQGVFAQGSFVTIGSQVFSIGYSGNWIGAPVGSTFTGGNDVVLRLVPEPCAGTLLALGALGLGMRRRRA